MCHFLLQQGNHLALEPDLPIHRLCYRNQSCWSSASPEGVRSLLLSPCIWASCHEVPDWRREQPYVPCSH